MVKICFPGLYSHDRGTSSTWRCLWLENENACSQAILNIILTWMRRHLCACKHTWWDAFQQPSLEHSQNLFLTVPVTGFVLLNALVSQKEPKLALSGCSDRLHSLNTTSTDEKKKKKQQHSIYYNFHLLRGDISSCFNPLSSVRPGPTTICLFRWPGPTPLHSSFLSAWSVCPHALPTCLSVGLSAPYHISAQGIEHWRMLVLSLYPNWLISFTAFLFMLGEESGCLPCCAFTSRIWNHQTWKTSVE